MDINSAFPSNYLKAGDLGGRSFRLVIKDVANEEIGGDHKLVIYFEKTDKGVVLNKTNATAIAQAYGNETDKWRGQAAEVFPSMTMFNGQNVACIRMRPFYPTAEGTPGAAPAPAPSPSPSPSPRTVPGSIGNNGVDLNDEVPF